MSANYLNSLNTDAPTVLCIDDDPDISECIAAQLQQYDVEVLRAFHGMHGLWLARTRRPDLIITDVRMPQGGGEYIVECLRSHPETKRIPIIILTGQRDSSLSAIALRFQVEASLVKPVQFSQLASTMKSFIPLSQRNPTDAAVEI
jgi:formate hydrogenlyase transcriptional activator